MGDNENVVLSIGASEHNMFVMRNLQEQFIEGKNCDLEIRLKDSKIYVHKCLTDMFFRKVGAELEKDMFYLNLKKYPRKLMAPLIDMMYHGNLSIRNSSVRDVIRVSSYIGFTQACDLLRKHMRANNMESSDNYRPSDEVQEDGQQPETYEGLVIKSEPQDEEMVDPNLTDTSNLRADVGASTATRVGNYSGEDTAKNIYVVYTPKDSEQRDSEILPSLKFKENSKKINDLIKDQDKTIATVTDTPYQTVKQIMEKNAITAPEKQYTKRAPRTLKTSQLTEPQFTKKSKTSEEDMFPAKSIKTEFREEPVGASAGRGLKKIDNSTSVNSNDAVCNLSFVAKNKVTKVTHVQSPGPQATNRPVGDYINTKNFRTAAANRMLEKSIMFEQASNDTSGKQDKGTSKQGGESGNKRMKRRRIDTITTFYNDDDDDMISKNKKTNPISKKSKVNIDYIEAGQIEYSEGGKTLSPSLALLKKTAVASTSSETNKNHVKMYLNMPKVNQDRDSNSDDQDSDNETEMDKYLKGNRDAKYFPPAALVPKGCRSSYAQSVFLKTKKVTETITNKNGDVMVVTKEIPVRSTIFNPKKQAEHGVAAVVVCHPTKPVVRPIV